MRWSLMVIGLVSLFSLTALAAEAPTGKGHGSVRRIPLVDTEGKESGCVFEYDGVCYASLDALQKKLLDKLKEKRPDLAAPKKIQIESLKEGMSSCVDGLLFNDKCFTSQEALINHLISLAGKPAEVTPKPPVPMEKPVTPMTPLPKKEEENTKLDPSVAKLKDEMIYITGGKDKDYVEGKLNEKLQYALIEIDWEALEKDAATAKTRGKKLEEEDKKNPFPSKAYTDPLRRIFLHGGKFRDTIESGNAHRFDIRGDLGKRPKYLLVQFKNSGYSSHQWDMGVVGLDEKGRKVDLGESPKGEMTIMHSPSGRYRSINVQELQNALGPNAKLIGIGPSAEPLIESRAR